MPQVCGVFLWGLAPRALVTLARVPATCCVGGWIVHGHSLPWGTLGSPLPGRPVWSGEEQGTGSGLGSQGDFISQRPPDEQNQQECSCEERQTDCKEPAHGIVRVQVQNLQTGPVGRRAMEEWQLLSEGCLEAEFSPP